MTAARWHKAEKGEVHEYVIAHAEEIERNQARIYDRIWALGCMYDPYQEDEDEETRRRVSENLIASNVDTITAIAASTEIRPRFTTNGAPWKERRKAKRLAGYSEGLTKAFPIHQEGTQAFKGSALKGSGFVKVTKDQGKLCIQDVIVDDVLVDEREARYGRPRQFHQRVYINRDDAIDRYSDFEEEIENALPDLPGQDRHFAGLPLADDQIVLLESWYLPSPDGKREGRHTVCIHGATLLDEPWTKDYFPFARIVWSERRPGYFGIGGGERISGHQERLDKYNWQLDRWLDRLAMPTTYVHQSDASLAVKTRNAAGGIAPYKGQEPKTVWPPAMSPDMLLRRNDIKDSGYEEFGTSRLTANAKKPSGIESGTALREYRDATTQRFALQEKAFEQLILDIVWLALDVCRELGNKAPVVYAPSRRKRFKWSEVDMEVVRTQLQAANNLPTTPAGRRQLVVELAQGGIIPTDEARRLLGPLDPQDLESALSPHTAAIDFVDWQIEEILDGNIKSPEPAQDLQIAVWRAQQVYMREVTEECPEEVCEALRSFYTQAAWVLAKKEEAAMMAAAPPPTAQPDPALAATAMQVQPA